ncbi:MAG: hypothetical protein AAFQ91_03450 [Cyanobacteria bacterium J06621_15]
MEPVSLWEWFWIILLFTIPGVNIIAFIICACGVGKPSVVNYCRACFVWFLVGIGLAILSGILLGAIGSIS